MIYFLGAAIGFVIGWFVHRWITTRVVERLIYEIMQYRKIILDLQQEMANGLR